MFWATSKQNYKMIVLRFGNINLDIYLAGTTLILKHGFSCLPFSMNALSLTRKPQTNKLASLSSSSYIHAHHTAGAELQLRWLRSWNYAISTFRMYNHLKWDTKKAPQNSKIPFQNNIPKQIDFMTFGNLKYPLLP